MSHDSHRFQILNADYEPEDLAAQLPRVGILLRQIPGRDRPDYWLAALDTPLSWNDSGTTREIKHVVLAARYVGQSISLPVRRLTTGISYVVDESVLDDKELDFHKCRYVAIGEIDRP